MATRVMARCCDVGTCHANITLQYQVDPVAETVRQAARIHGRRRYRHWLMCAHCHEGDLCVACVRAGRAATAHCAVCGSANWMHVTALERVLASIVSRNPRGSGNPDNPWAGMGAGTEHVNDDDNDDW